MPQLQVILLQLWNTTTTVTTITMPLYLHMPWVLAAACEESVKSVLHSAFPES
jgi:hypothetical protein